MLEYIIGIIIVILSVKAFLNFDPTPKKIFGTYTQPTRLFYFKVLAFYLLLQLRKLGSRSKSNKKKGEAGYGVKSKTKIEDMECPQLLSEHPKAIDAVYFNAADENGNYIVIATARRPKGVINGLLYIRLPEYGVLELPKMPDTLLFGKEDKFEAEGLSIAPVEAMKWWKLDFSGKMKLNDDNSRTFDVKLDMNWTSNQEYFDFDTDMHPIALSRSMAREPWSRKYFQDLKEAHQTHYEQMGLLRGYVEVDGKRFDLRLNSMRDHSYGHKREWKLMHRYGLHMFHTEDGYSMNVGIICQPITCSMLELGYVNTPSGQKIAVSSVNLPLWQHGELGTPPVDYAFSFIAGGKAYFVEVQVIESPTFYIGWEWETRVVERMASFRVNGKKGWGMAEWDYRYKGGRPEKYASKDPEWTKSLNKG